MKEQNNKINYKCTILIPTYNRPNRLKRLLSYYNKYGKDFNIIIADASSNENKRLNKKNISLFSNLKIIYLDNYPSKILPYYKICGAVNYINTKYTVFCADDDFITPNGINRSIDFLEKNPDFTIAQGYYISFYLKNKDNRNFFWVPYPSKESLTFSESRSRLVFYLSNSKPVTLYGVRRTKNLKMASKEIMKFTNNTMFSDLLLVTLDMVYGKIKRLDLLYGAGEIIPHSWTIRVKHLTDFIKEGTYDQQYTQFRECLSTHLSKKSNLSIVESKKIIDDAMLPLLKRIYKVRHGSPVVKITKVLNILLPHWMYEKIRELYMDILFLKKVRMDSFWNLIDNPSFKYYDDFSKIRSHVLSQSKK